MTGPNVGPYRATTLWNEAVGMFRDNMPLQEHRHRLHKHRKSFTGHDAVSFLHGALCSNPLFNPDVTREQACQLLNQFLKADLITPVQNCSIANHKRVFYDSYKYLYEFTETLVNFKRLTPLSEKFRDNSKANTFSGNDSQKENLMNITAEKSWKLAVIKRIIELLKPLNLSELAYMKEINSKWVATNANPEWNKIKWNTELPHWILSTMHKLLKYSSRDYCESAYPSFQLDAFKVISDYFKTLENPIVLQCFYKIYIEIFHYLDYLNNLKSTSYHEMKISTSQEDLIFRISSPLKTKLKSNVVLSKNNLPPNHCYEAAFINDDPTFRVVPQSSVDSVHLQKGFVSESKINELVFNDSSITSKKNTFVVEKKRMHTSKSKKTPLKLLSNNNRSYKSFTNIKSGIVNEGFAVFSPGKSYNENHLDMFKHRSYDCLNTKSFTYSSENSIKKDMSSQSCYVNHGLSFSLEDINLLANDRLDYSYALESLDRLLKVTKYNISSSDDDYSFHTALSSSEADISGPELLPESSIEIPTSDVCWNEHIKSLGVTIFQLLLMLLPPCNRAQMKNLSVLMFEVSHNTTLPELSLQNMLQELSNSILRPNEIKHYNTVTTNKILSFIVNNHVNIFTELSSDLLSVITNEIYENQIQALTFCKQISEKQFEQQKYVESNIALNQLLDHIIKNKNISEKERKKHLKVFKESYPNIYKERFPAEPTSTKSKVLFSFKNFRL